MNFLENLDPAITVPAFAAIWSAGFLSCQWIRVNPLVERVEKMETKLEAIETERNEELKELRRLVHGK